MPTNVVVYLDHDNTINLQLLDDGSAVDLSGATKIELKFPDGTVIDSDTSPDAFDWSEGSGKLTLALGDESLDKGNYLGVWIVVYTAGNPDGLVWENGLNIKALER